MGAGGEEGGGDRGKLVSEFCQKKNKSRFIFFGGGGCVGEGGKNPNLRFFILEERGRGGVEGGENIFGVGRRGGGRNKLVSEF